jgi:hypothetical protein
MIQHVLIPIGFFDIDLLQVQRDSEATKAFRGPNLRMEIGRFEAVV